MTRSHDELRDLIAPVALGAAGEDEAIAVEAHARGCADCRRELEELRAAAGMLALAPDEVEPPAGLRESIMAEVRADAQAMAVTRGREGAPAAEAPAAPPSRGATAVPWWRTLLRPWPAAAVAMAAIAGVLLVWNVALQVDRPASPDPVVATSVAGTTDAPDLSGRMIYVSDEGELVLRLQGLEQLPRGEAYHLWTIDDGIPRWAGSFRADASGQATVVASEAGDAEAIGLTSQPYNSTTAPEGPLLLTASLGTA